VLGLHLLTLLYVVVVYSLSQPGLLAVHVAVSLGYGALTLAAQLVKMLPGRVAFHTAASAVVVLILPICPQAILLLPFHIVKVLPRTYVLSYPVYALSVGLMAGFGVAQTDLRVAVVLWSAGVIGLDRLIERQRRLLDDLAHRLASAENENVRLGDAARTGERMRTAGELLTRLEERHAVAGKLHDQLGHMVAGSLFQLEAARVVLGDDTERAASMISNTERVLKEGMESIRHHLHTLDPGTDEIGVGRLERLVYEFDERSSIRAGLGLAGPVDVIPAAVWEAVHDNVTEALTNCARHSNATTVDVSLEVFPGVIKLQVRDNGHPSSSPVRHGMGLRGIDERTAQTGGILTVDSSNGFSVVCLWRR
jgi:signal transduction histidine kinase